MRNLVAHPHNLEALKSLKNSKPSEVIIALKHLSRRSYFDQSILTEMIKFDHSYVCEFDVLSSQFDFKLKTDFFKSIDKEIFTSVRAQDFGVIQWLKINTDLPIQLNLETGHHNFESIQTWIDYLGDRLEKIILSYELPLETIQNYVSKINDQNIKVELLGFGSILLFYSPRSLVSRLPGEVPGDQEMIADSLESPHQGFIIKENDEGTYMYHLKDLNYLNEESLPEELDFRIELNDKFIYPLRENLKNSMASQTRKQTKGYLRVNKSDVLFKKLRNQKLVIDEEKFIGEVISHIKGECLIINLKGKRDLYLEDEIIITSPEGESKVLKVTLLESLSGKSLNSSQGSEFIKINFAKKMTAKSIIHQNSTY